jgi:hypothetical protein
MLMILVHEGGARQTENLINPSHVTRIAFHPERRCGAGETLAPMQADVYLLGHNVNGEPDCLAVRDPKSIELLRRLDTTPRGMAFMPVGHDDGIKPGDLG